MLKELLLYIAAMSIKPQNIRPTVKDVELALRILLADQLMDKLNWPASAIKRLFPDVPGNILKEGMSIQELSFRQKKVLSEAETLKVSMDKGGRLMILLNRFLKLGESDRDAYYVGAFAQLIDDYVDVLKDRAEGFHTVFTDYNWDYDKLVKFTQEVIVPNLSQKWRQFVMEFLLRYKNLLKMLQTLPI